MVLAEKSPKTFPKHKGYYIILLYIIFDFIIFDCVKLIEYIASAVNVVSPNPCVGSFIGIKISFPLLSIWTDEFIPAPKIMTFLLVVFSGNK